MKLPGGSKVVHVIHYELRCCYCVCMPLKFLVVVPRSTESWGSCGHHIRYESMLRTVHSRETTKHDDADADVGTFLIQHNNGEVCSPMKADARTSIGSVTQQHVQS